MIRVRFPGLAALPLLFIVAPLNAQQAPQDTPPRIISFQGHLDAAESAPERGDVAPGRGAYAGQAETLRRGDLADVDAELVRWREPGT